MNIEKRLKQDAARFAHMQPPADLRARLQASLDAVPPIPMPRMRRPVRPWFAPAVAILSLAMVLVFISALPSAPAEPLRQDGVFTEGMPEADSVEITSDTKDYSAPDRSLDMEVKEKLPFAKIGIFAGLALVTGLLCVTELKGRPRLLVPALAALVLFLAVGFLYIIGA